MSNQKDNEILPINYIYEEVLGEEILVVTQDDQLNILGQTFRPIFTGKVTNVTNGYLTLNPAIIKMHNAPFFRFPTPLNIPLEGIAWFTPFDPNRRLPLV
ncbi:hypothetical protein M3181_20385 [Mesobacillus maritimus]|uniref:hypothetical protein n=1 Tax=Mesobacillus maritimus TaxID=1643336 RepID=UPI00203CB37C|nr:hypothetical protein [Mesobacillus maritimus]MCM3671321.1 hypothetical protein [Mesobacillus maritimus]